MTGLVPNAGFDLSGFPWLPLTEKVFYQEGPGILAKDFTDSGVPLVRLSGLGGYQVTLNGCDYVSTENGSSKWGHFRLRKGDILVSTSASFGRPAVVGDEAEGAIFYTGLIRFTPKTDDLDAGYLKTFLGSELFMRQAEAMASGSVIRHFGPTHLREMHIPVPPLSDQRAIAAVLGALDDKIELNRRMNETLEAMARAIFRDWFVDFGPTRAKIEGRAPYFAPDIWSLFPDRLDDEGKPEGWSRSSIGQEVEVVGGSTPSTKEGGFWGGDISWATPKDLSSLSTPVLLSTERQITEAGLAQIGSGLLPVGTVLLSSRAPIGYMAIAQIPVAVNQGFIAMLCKKRLSNVFVWLWTQANMETVHQNANGSTFQEISKANFRPIEMTIATPEILRTFDVTARPLFDRIVVNEKENRTLTATRDFLLPKLMSGEVCVKEAKKLVEEDT